MERDGKPRVSTCAVHAAPIVASSIWGAGSVVSKLGVHDTNPLLFSLIRDCLAGPCLCAIAYALRAERPRRKHWRRLTLLGACVFCDQSFNVVGVKLSSAITSALWQPTTPIITTAIALSIGQERFTWLKCGGIVVGAAGAMFVAVDGAQGASGKHALQGSVCFAINCSASATYAILAKPLLGSYASISLTGWACIAIAGFKPAPSGWRPARSSRVCAPPVARPDRCALHLARRRNHLNLPRDSALPRLQPTQLRGVGRAARHAVAPLLFRAAQFDARLLSQHVGDQARTRLRGHQLLRHSCDTSEPSRITGPTRRESHD